MLPAQWHQQQPPSSGRGVSSGSGSGSRVLDAEDLSAWHLQTLALEGLEGLEGLESIPSARSTTIHDTPNHVSVAFPVLQGQGNLFEGVKGIGILSTTTPHDPTSMITVARSPHDLDAAIAPDASSLSTLSQGESKPVDSSIPTAPLIHPLGDGGLASVAELCKAPEAAFLMNRNDAHAYIGLKGMKVEKLKHRSGATMISVRFDRVYNVDGKRLVLVVVKGHPLSVHRAVQLTESLYEIYPAPPGAAAEALVAPTTSSKKTSSKSPKSTGSSPTSAADQPPLGAPQQQQQAPIRIVSPASGNVSPPAPRRVLKVEIPAALSETEVSADSESSIGRYSSSPPKLEMLEFCRAQAACLRTSPEDFARWLLSQDVESLPDLLEAVNDDDFRDEMQENGLKGFKKAAFKKAIQAVVGP